MASMNAPMPDSILHDGWGSIGGYKSLNRGDRGERTRSARRDRDRVMLSGGSLALREVRWALLHSFGAALADQKQTDALQQVGGRIHSPGKEHVGLRVVIVNADLARNQDGRGVGRETLDGGDQLRAVEARHGHVGDHQIDAAQLEAFQRFFAARVAGDAIAAGFEHDFAIGEGLFFLVTPKDGAFWFHPPPVSTGSAADRKSTEIFSVRE